jgi:hypothetical protein
MQMVGIWSVIEEGSGITLACLATLRPLLTSFVQRYKYPGSDDMATSSRRHWIFGMGSSKTNTMLRFSKQSRPKKRTSSSIDDSIERYTDNQLNSLDLPHSFNMSQPLPPPNKTYRPRETIWSELAPSPLEEKTAYYSISDETQQSQKH